MNYTLEQVQAVFKKKGFVMYTKPFDLNIFGVRAENSASDSFDDIIGCWFKSGINTVYKTWPATTDPGKSWLLTPMRSEGTAILVPGQYRGMYKKGVHKTYPALEQRAVAKYVRDNNKDLKLDFELYRDPQKAKSNVVVDLIKSNIHKAGTFSKLVANWSASCQVFQKEADFNELMSYVDKQLAAGIGNIFSYTLLEQRDFQ